MRLETHSLSHTHTPETFCGFHIVTACVKLFRRPCSMNSSVHTFFLVAKQFYQATVASLVLALVSAVGRHSHLCSRCSVWQTRWVCGDLPEEVNSDDRRREASSVCSRLRRGKNFLHDIDEPPPRPVNSPQGDRLLWR